MAKTLTIVSTAIVTAILTSAFWIFAYNIALRPKSADGPSLSADATPRTATRSPQRETNVSLVQVGPAGIAVPVGGVRTDQLVDTYSQARAGGARLHDAMDIMADAGAPVIAVADSRVEKLFFSAGGGGITAYLRSPDKQWMYYFAHLQEYAPGLREGQTLKRGELVGRVGSTGNATSKGPHLHFAIHRMTDRDKWWQGTPVNPYPLLVGK